MKVQFAAGDGPGPAAQAIQTEISSWAPERGPDWIELQARVRERPLKLFRFYSLAGVAIVALLTVGYLALAAFGVGGLTLQPVESHTVITNLDR